MKSSIDAIEQMCHQQVKKADELLRSLEKFGWKDTRPARIKEKRETRFELLDLGETTTVTLATARIPNEFIHAYHDWYSASLALVEGNMPARLNEMLAQHEGVKGAQDGTAPITHLLQGGRMTFDQQIRIASRILHMKSVVGSIAAYMRARLHDVDLVVAQVYVHDELSEAGVLLKGGFVRAAGAVAGVLIERHLKLLCDRHQPSIRYAKAATISRLNDLLRDNSVYDVAQWRKVQWMGDVRNSCDHVRVAEPRKQDVEDLIQEVKKFASLFVV